MGHGHGHDHGVSRGADRRRLWTALGLILAFMVAEVTVGVLASSLALISDAAHMLTDAAAIALSLLAIHLAAKPPRGAMTFGLGRAEALSAQANGLTLALFATLIAIEGVRRLVDTPDVDAWPVLIVALVGVGVNLVATWLLARADRRSLAVEGSYQHIVTDLAAFIFTAIAAAIILGTGFDRADAIASLLVAAIMLRSAWGLLRASGRVFLEAAPEGLDPAEIGTALAAQPGVVDVHDLHVWEVAAGFPALSAHVLVEPDCDCHGARRALEALLDERFGLTHTTLQVDHRSPSRLLQVEQSDARGA
jgi:cobalt-zinc-cadmium efflux system protein